MNKTPSILFFNKKNIKRKHPSLMNKTRVIPSRQTRYFCLQRLIKLVLTTLKLKKDEEKSHFFNCAANG